MHGLLDQSVGLLECARRLQLALNTVKRYAHADQPERMLRVPKYRASLVGPYREHLRKRRTEDPAVPVKHLFEEIKTLGFTGCLNLLHKYINQGRADTDRSHISARRLARMLLTKPANPKDEHHDLLEALKYARRAALGRLLQPDCWGRWRNRCSSLAWAKRSQCGAEERPSRTWATIRHSSSASVSFGVARSGDKAPRRR